MTDFYGRLEEQLLTAAGRRAERGGVGRAFAGRRSQLMTALAAAAAVAAGLALLPDALRSTGATGPASPASSRSAPLPAPSGVLSGIRVAVLNGTLQPGRARECAGRLQRRGAVIGIVGNYHRQSDDTTTAVRYRSGAGARARRVAAVLRVPRVTKATAADIAVASDARVVVVVGARR